MTFYQSKVLEERGPAAVRNDADQSVTITERLGGILCDPLFGGLFRATLVGVNHHLGDLLRIGP